MIVLCLYEGNSFRFVFVGCSNSFICLAVYSQYDSDDSAHEGQNGQRLDSSIEK